MTSCAFRGRENDAEARFGFNYGAPLHPFATRVGPEYLPRPLEGQPLLRSALNAGALSFASRASLGNQAPGVEHV